MSIRRNDQLIRYSPLTTVASTPKAMIRTTPIGTLAEGRSRPRIKPMTRPLATGSSSSTINHSPLTVGNSRTISATKSSAHWRLVGTTRTLLLVHSFSLLSSSAHYLRTCAQCSDRRWKGGYHRLGFGMAFPELIFKLCYVIALIFVHDFEVPSPVVICLVVTTAPNLSR
jgi:hypothetical protein